MPDVESLYEQFKSMGVNLGAGKGQPKARQPGKPRSHGIETVLNGKEVPTVYGQAFVIEEQFPTDYQHGRISLCCERDMQMLANWSATPRITNPGCENIVYLDTETSGLAGGTGTYVFLVGIGYRIPSGFQMVQLFMRDPGEEAALLAALDQWLGRFDAVVTFNGKSFDIPLLNTRYQMNGLTSPFGSFDHLDVLQIARRLWRDRLPSRALSELEKEVVQFYRTGEDIPGWMIPQMYFDYLNSGDARPLHGIFYHNTQDILSLAALTGHVAEMLNQPLGETVNYGLDLAAIARLYEEMGRLEQAATLYERSLEMGDMLEPSFLKIMERFALLRRKTGQWEQAAELWHKAADHGEINACVELSKYYEHRVRDYSEALVWARRAMEALDSSRSFEGSYRAMEREIERRIGRLYQRVYRGISDQD